MSFIKPHLLCLIFCFITLNSALADPTIKNERNEQFFSTVPHALEFIAGCLEQDNVEKLSAALIGDKIKPSQFLPFYEMIKKFHKKNDLRKFYGDKTFPKKNKKFKLGGHGPEFLHLHFDFVKKEKKWFLLDIYNCR